MNVNQLVIEKTKEFAQHIAALAMITRESTFRIENRVCSVAAIGDGALTAFTMKFPVHSEDTFFFSVRTDHLLSAVKNATKISITYDGRFVRIHDGRKTSTLSALNDGEVKEMQKQFIPGSVRATLPTKEYSAIIDDVTTYTNIVEHEAAQQKIFLRSKDESTTAHVELSINGSGDGSCTYNYDLVAAHKPLAKVYEHVAMHYAPAYPLSLVYECNDMRATIIVAPRV